MRLDLSFVIFICYFHLPTVFASVYSNKLIYFRKNNWKSAHKTTFVLQIKMLPNVAKLNKCCI